MTELDVTSRMLHPYHGVEGVTAASPVLRPLHANAYWSAVQYCVQVPEQLPQLFGSGEVLRFPVAAHCTYAREAVQPLPPVAAGTLH